MQCQCLPEYGKVNRKLTEDKDEEVERVIQHLEYYCLQCRVTIHPFRSHCGGPLGVQCDCKARCEIFPHIQGNKTKTHPKKRYKNST